MKQIVDFIQKQIQQIEPPELRDWVLSHFNVDAHYLTELFCKQGTVFGNHSQSTPSLSIRLPSHLFALVIFYTYAPQSLVQELSLKLASSPLEKSSLLIPQMALRERLTQQLKDYHDAWPIIIALQKQGFNQLVLVMNEAEEKALRAFARLTKDSDLALLAETCLIKNDNDLELINRSRLIQFLRQPDGPGWLSRYLESLISQYNNVMSLRFLGQGFDGCFNELTRLAELEGLLNEYPLSLHLPVIRAISLFYQPELKKDLSSPVSHKFMQLLYAMLSKLDAISCQEFITGLTPEYVALMMEHCLRGCVDEESQHQHACKKMMLLFCSLAPSMGQEYLELLKSKLQQWDNYLFDSSSLEQLGRELFQQATGISAPVSDGLWMRQLLTSPRFIAAATPQVIQQLSARYALCVLTLNSAALNQLLLSVKEHNPYSDSLIMGFKRVEHHLLNHSEHQHSWIARKDRLVTFSIDSCVNALFGQLEEQCEYDASGEKALAVLYRYYNQTYSTLRVDLLLQVIDYCYREGTEQANDGATNSILVSWFNRYFPSHYLEQHELVRKKEIGLYNSVGAPLGWLQQSNEALAFVNDEPMALIKTELALDDGLLYDQKGTVIGVLTASGQVMSADLFHKNVCAQLLRLVPEQDLERAPPGLQLLIQSVLFECSLGVLYGVGDVALTAEKKLWLERQFFKVVKEMHESIAPESLNSLVHYHSEKNIFSLLGVTENSVNALTIFHSILMQEQRRDALFSGLYEANFYQFLEQHGGALACAEYLIKYYDKPWFLEGLSCFAQYGGKFKKDHLLSEALTILVKRVEHDESLRSSYNALLERLIGSESAAMLVLNKFLKDHVVVSVSEVSGDEISRVTRFFSPRLLIAVIQKLNRSVAENVDAQYRLILHILDKQYPQLFQQLPPKHPWQGNELRELAHFIGRYLTKKSLADSEFSIAHRVLGELLFRCAYSGQTSLFYRNNVFNPHIARLSFLRPFLVRLIDKFWMPNEIKERIADPVMRIRTWFEGQRSALKGLQGHQALDDWHHLVNETWMVMHKKKLPIICAYLLNYSGPRLPLFHLLRDYFHTFRNSTEYLHPVSQLLQQFPDRDVSAVVFEALEATVKKNPSSFDLPVLRDMAQYYAKKIARKGAKSADAELNLVTYFGQEKHYALVKKGCDELIKVCDDKGLKKRLVRGANEAKVEQSLTSSLGRFYFGFIAFWTRLWHYGFNVAENTSKIVKLCDDQSHAPTHQLRVDPIKLPPVGTSSDVNTDFGQKHKQLISLLATINRSSAITPLVSKPSSSGAHGIFHSKFKEQEKVVASQQPVVNI